MKRLVLFTLLALPLLSHAQADFNVTIGDPGYNGQIYFDNGQQPKLMNETPIIAYPGPPQPIYLRVPLYVYQDWAHYCRDYHACYTPVYFVQNDWYKQYYIPWYHNRYPYNIPKYQNRYPYDVPKYQNRYPDDVPKYVPTPAPRGDTLWQDETPAERYQRNSNEVEIQHDE